MGVGERRGDGDFGAGHAALGIIELVVIGDHVADGEEPALGGDELDEIGGEPEMPALSRIASERLDLLARRKDGAAHQALQGRRFRAIMASKVFRAAATSSVAWLSWAKENRAEA